MYIVYMKQEVEREKLCARETDRHRKGADRYEGLGVIHAGRVHVGARPHAISSRATVVVERMQHLRALSSLRMRGFGFVFRV